MAGYDGLGNFTRNYNWVQDAANGVKIVASRQDTEMATIVAGFNTAMCRDGQAVWTGNQNAGGKSITNLLGTGIATGNAIIASDVYGLLSPFATQSTDVLYTCTWISNLSFTINGSDRTATYLPGTRIQTNSPTAGLRYQTVKSSSFGGGNTTIVLTADSPGIGVDISNNGVTKISILTPIGANSAMPFGSIVGLFVSATSQNVASVTTYNVGTATTFPISQTVNDTFSEFSGTTFTAVQAGWYYVDLYFGLSRNAATISASGSIAVVITGSGNLNMVQSISFPTDSFTAALYIPQTHGWVWIPAGGTIKGQITAPTFTGGPMVSGGAQLNIVRER